MKIDICIPAYNEEAVIAEAVQTVKEALMLLPGEKRIIVADNGSTDRTATAATEAGAVVWSQSERGKGAALIDAAIRSDADIFGFIDADLSADPKNFLDLWRLLEGGADLAVGSRLLDEKGVQRGFLRALSSKGFNMLRKLLLGIKVEDTQCGLKLMNSRGKAVLRECQERGWFFDMELLALAEREGLMVKETAVRWEEFRFTGRSSKLRLLRDGVGALLAMLRIRRRLATI